MMEIQLSTIKGDQNFSISIDSNAKIADLKSAFAEKYDIKANVLRIIFNSNICKDDSSLQELGIIEGSQLKVYFPNNSKTSAPASPSKESPQQTAQAPQPPPPMENTPKVEDITDQKTENEVPNVNMTPPNNSETQENEEIPDWVQHPVEINSISESDVASLVEMGFSERISRNALRITHDLNTANELILMGLLNNPETNKCIELLCLKNSPIAEEEKISVKSDLRELIYVALKEASHNAPHMNNPLVGSIIDIFVSTIGKEEKERHNPFASMFGSANPNVNQSNPFAGYPNYGAQMPNYGTQMPNYGTQMPNYGAQMPNYGGSSYPNINGMGYPGVNNPFGGMNNPYGGMSNPYGGMNNPYANMQNPFGSLFGGMNNPFNGMGGFRSQFGGMPINNPLNDFGVIYGMTKKLSLYMAQAMTSPPDQYYNPFARFFQESGIDIRSIPQPAINLFASFTQPELLLYIRMTRLNLSSDQIYQIFMNHNRNIQEIDAEICAYEAK